MTQPIATPSVFRQIEDLDAALHALPAPTPAQASVVAQHLEAALGALRPEPTHAERGLPAGATPGLLISMALRYDPALGMPGYYDRARLAQGPRGAALPTHAQQYHRVLAIVAQLYEEATGQGFYSPDKEDLYTRLGPGPDDAPVIFGEPGLGAQDG